MIFCIGNNIISSLGFSTKENYEAVINGQTGLSLHENTFGIPEPFFASLIDEEMLNNELIHNFKDEDLSSYTKFEKLLLLSIKKANDEAKIDFRDKNTLFILSTTKGNISYLSDEMDEKVYLWHSAHKVTSFFGNENEPLVISNACISGAAAQVEALRLIENCYYENCVVVGGELLSKFIISGFQSFKALSQEQCQPFDKNRHGLNLGEAAATIIYSKENKTNSKIVLLKGAIRNDARHISAPSIEAEGLYNCLVAITEDVDKNDIAFVNAHGTATIYNDEMEALALNRIAMQHIPTNSLKAHFGHTLGAAGLLESVISMQALQDGIVLKSTNCKEVGAKHEINVAQETMRTDKSMFMKMVSGFGGSNAALVFKKIDNETIEFSDSQILRFPDSQTVIEGKLKDNVIYINDIEHKLEDISGNILDNFYRKEKLSYPKFFKMDSLSKAGFIVSELMLREAGFDIETPKKDMAILLCNRSSSSDDDLIYLQSIKDKDNYFPSPSVFVYTLPNIVAGEMAIRNKIFGETSFYVSECYSKDMMLRQVNNVLSNQSVNYVLFGWVEALKGNYEVELTIIKKS